MNLMRLRYFLTVVDLGSISSAAERLHMTQPPLSQAIRAFEEEIGVSLLERLPRGVAPTEAGRQLAEDGAQLLNWSETIIARAREIGAGQAGILRVSAVPTVSWSLLPQLLKDMCRRAPGVTFELSDPDPAGVLLAIENGSADVGFVSTADVALLRRHFSDLVLTEVGSMALALVVPPGRASMTWAELAEMTWIVPTVIRGFPGLDEISEQLWRARGIAPTRVQRVSTLQTALPLVATDMAVCLVPEKMLEMIGGAFDTVDLPTDIAPIYVAMVHSARLVPTPTVKTFLSLVAPATDVSL